MKVRVSWRWFWPAMMSDWLVRGDRFRGCNWCLDGWRTKLVGFNVREELEGLLRSSRARFGFCLLVAFSFDVGKIPHGHGACVATRLLHVRRALDSFPCRAYYTQSHAETAGRKCTHDLTLHICCACYCRYRVGRKNSRAFRFLVGGTGKRPVDMRRGNAPPTYTSGGS